ncbi:uncharacterized protein L3040_003923 [Drepanopeziza brunnea f. sp. 'multigermtubi']|uniref:uncharacterized protein n=1 Tax=Drepanopeziza brunnea f. sp. 'multigermtubi' TaxID=698441 RepID=UPI00238F3ED8|nr:hypothetical protein L3040_003923 [Drepanopeziza brunnea f. sp. 'multigermtubi']
MQQYADARSRNSLWEIFLVSRSEVNQQPDDPFVNTSDLSSIGPFSMESDAAFTVTPLVSRQRMSIANSEEAVQKNNSTFIQDQLNVQRSPSTVKDHASALSRQLSVKSNGSKEGTTHPALTSFLTTTPENPSKISRGREYPERDETGSVDTTNTCKLSKSSSERSTKSVISMAAIGTHSFGTLRVHSPSPTRAPNIKGCEILKSGDVAVVRDLPIGVIFGYDTVSLGIKQLGVFEGVKSLPHGAHLIWAGTSDGSLRTGFWLMSGKLASDQYGEVIVKKWDQYNESLVEEISAAEIRIQESNLLEFADKLRDYTVKQIDGLDSSIWTRLTSCMKVAHLQRVTGQKDWNNWAVSSSHDVKFYNSTHTDKARHYGKDEVLDFVFPKNGRTFSSRSIGRERTEQAMDTSSHIMAIISGSCAFEDSDEIIGELQFCYLTGMLLGNIACMEHWAYMIRTIFRAFRLVVDLPVFCRKFIKAVHAQMMYDGVGIEGSIFDMDGSLENDLKNILITFKSRLDEQLLTASTRLTPDQKAVGDAFAEFESFLWKWRGGWDLRGNFVRSGQVQLEDGEFVDAELSEFEAEDERGEYAPAIVELDEDGREKGLVDL